MSLRLATFNIENLLSRFDFSGFRNQLKQDRVLRLFDVKTEAEYQRLEEARTIAHTDDTRQMSALAIADCDADILCLQEADNMASLQAFEYNYLFRMVGNGYRQKYLIEGNDSRGIDVAVLMREETRDGQPIECLEVKSHAGLTYEDLDLFNDQIALTNRPADRIFKRDCLELDLRIGGRPLTLYVVHFKSMGPAREGLDGRQATMPLRVAEASAVRHIIESRFGRGKTADKMFAICGDMNDYQEKVNILGDRRNGYQFVPHEEASSSLDVFSHDGFAENPMLRRPVLDRWTLFHSRGPQERHLCQLDYIWLSPALAERNATQVPEVIRGGQPFRTIFPPELEVERYPRTGWDRPKASDHCPVAITLDV
ncbi:MULTISPECIES: endonuclease/exonuclease/phosphatase family protein [unclassified Ensifer]|uniref:endonuclease/exonuclease/phosphatase family protein n=1 Tax=unclassified Ensifer TaxID=2633371 RepID=UPI0008131C22|nr:MULTISPECIES: endonuclease/exonuclease/phosphatase family protein [unclassified Ensifer]OCP04392.1 endonuclease [Ensifer sp. LC11]OCP04672.1 endonuclease [Ensifer sp. LC13]OCP13331.1 endonuclease [Ensifer sp. LC14]OCP30496.1 endonuclease [Ensifer sp. LC499]